MRTLEEVNALSLEQQASILIEDIKQQVYEKFATDAEAFCKLPTIYKLSSHPVGARDNLAEITFLQRFGQPSDWVTSGDASHKYFLRMAFLQFPDEMEAVDELPIAVRRLLHDGPDSPDARGLIASMWTLEASSMPQYQIMDEIKKGVSNFHAMVNMRHSARDLVRQT